MQSTTTPWARALMILALLGLAAVVGAITDQVASYQASRVMLRVTGADPNLVYRLAFSLMLLYLLLSMLPLLMVIAYRGLQPDSLKTKVIEALALCALNDQQVQQRLAEYEQRNSVSAFVLPALVNLLLLQLVWGNALLPRGIEGLLDAILAQNQPWFSLARVFPDAVGSITPLTWALLGAYFYSLTLTLQRWMRYDLTTNVLWQINVRLVTTFVLGLLLMGLAGGAPGSVMDFGPFLAALAFVVGIVPDVFMNWVGQQLKRLGGIDVEQNGRLFAPSDLQSKIGGMSFWQAGRLVEEGIESVHDLATKELPTLMIATRFDPALLLDWVDRALLCKQADVDLALLQRAHIYTATDLLARVGADVTLAPGVPALLRSLADAATPDAPSAGAATAALAPISAATLGNLVQGLGNGPNLRYLRAYRANVGAPLGAVGDAAAVPAADPITPGVAGVVPGPAGGTPDAPPVAGAAPAGPSAPDSSTR